LGAWASANPARAAEWKRTQSGELTAGWEEKLPRFSSGDKPLATRAASGHTINAIADSLPELIGGSADLKSSNNTEVKGQEALSAQNYGGRNVWFGVREHAMGAMLNGLCLHGGIRPYGATFLTFSDYVRPSLRLAALMRQPVIYVFTHDSIFLGEDGPTHQPVEHMAALRSIPNLWVIRPADANETAAAWALALGHKDGPTALILSRQGLPHLDDTGPGRGSERGGYVMESVSDSDPQLLLLATGSEVHVSCEAAKLLRQAGIRTRVINLPCWELFDAQPQEYRDSVLPPAVRKRLAVEAGRSLGWERYVGDEGLTHTLEGFGVSAPLGDLTKKFGFTAEAIAAKAKGLLEA
jgi:transketolase